MQLLDFQHPLAVRVRKDIVRALNDFHMIRPQEKIMVAVSGGKDSTILALLLKQIQTLAPFPFTFEAVMVDQKQPGFAPQEFISFFQDQKIPLTILERDTYSLVLEKVPEGHTFCSLCSRLRRGILYNHAYSQGYTRIALGHHRDDLLETLLMNLFYSGRLASMPPKLLSNDSRNVLIRPLAYVAEKDLVELRDLWKFPVLPCGLCGSQDGLKRDKMRDLLDQLEMETPDIRQTMLHALSKVEPSQLLDKNLVNFNLMESQPILEV